jgi:hypothetical protein
MLVVSSARADCIAISESNAIAMGWIFMGDILSRTPNEVHILLRRLRTDPNNRRSPSLL